MRALLIAVALAVAGAAHAATDAQRSAFLDALAAARHGKLDSVSQEVAELRHYPLYNYLQAAQLKYELGAHPDRKLDRRIAAFIANHPKLPPAQRLRGPWLASLAQRQRWHAVVAHTRADDDTTAQCRLVHARIELGANPVDAALALYAAGHSQPSACDPVFAWLNQTNRLSAAVIRDRAHRAVLADHYELAHYLAGQMPKAKTPTIDRWIGLARHPADLASAPPDLDPAIAVHVFKRWALQDLNAAANHLQAVVARLHLDADHSYQMRRYVALLFAENHRPEALLWFARIDHQRMAGDAHALGWEIRAAVYRQRWPLVLDAIARLPAKMAQASEWRYWKARALAATGHKQQADAIYAVLAQHRSYHGYLAADALGEPYHFNARPLPANPKAMARVKAHPALARAHELYILGMTYAANREWRVLTADLDPAALAQAARLAFQWHWYSRAITTLARAGYWDDLDIRYPTPYRAAVEKAADKNDLDPAYVLAIMRTESLFQPEASSRAGARGLMQLMPDTADRVARALGDSPPAASRLDSPTLNIRLGARYLHDMLANWSDNLVLATASYNAGPGKIAQWLPNRTLPADIWIANIPYTETRHYVQRAMSHMTVFQHRLTESLVPLDRRLHAVKPSYPDDTRISF